LLFHKQRKGDVVIIIKNSKELEKLTDKNKDLIRPYEDIRIEFEPARSQIRNVESMDLFMKNDRARFDFNGRNFKGRDFNGRDFNGRDFNGRDFNGRNFNGQDFNGWNFNGRDFNGWDFKGRKVSYWGFFNCYGKISYESIEARRNPHAEPVSLTGEIEITGSSKKDDMVEITVEGKVKKISRISAKELNLIE
jgi:hypothetical protein